MGFFEVGMLIAAVIGAGVAVRNQQLAEDAQDASNATAKDQSRISTRQAIRERRIKMAQVEQASSNQGVGGSSGELGAASSIGAQFSTNAGFAAAQSTNRGIINDAQSQMNRNNLISTAAQSVFQIGSVSGAGANNPNVAGASNDLDALMKDNTLF